MLVWCLIGSPLVGALVLWLRRCPRALPFATVVVPCASCWRPTAFSACVGGRCLDCRLAPFFADIAAHVHEPPRAAYHVPPAPPIRHCGDCGATLPPRHPWAACTACTGVRVTAAYLARTTRRTVAVSEDELRRIWDRVAW